MMLKVHVPVETGNATIRSGKLAQAVQGFLAEWKPEAAYFYLEGGQRTAVIVLDMERTSQIPRIAETFFLGLDASVELVPVMAVEDLQAGLADIPAVIERTG